MELRQLRYLLAIAEEGNFTRAAEKVFVSQSALSQQIQTLEQELETILLERSRKGIRLTPAGQILCDHAWRVVHEIEQAQVAIGELEGLKRGELRVGVVQTVNGYLMPGIVSTFAECYPNVKLFVEELSADDLERWLEDGDVQIGIGFTPPALPGIVVEELFEERLVLVTRRDHPLAGRDAVPVATLHDLPMVMLARSFCTRRLWEENARLVSAQPKVMLEMNSVSGILSVIRKTGLATVLPHLTLAEEHSPDLVSVNLINPVPSRRVGLLWNQETYLCSASRAFREIARKTAAAMVNDMLVRA